MFFTLFSYSAKFIISLLAVNKSCDFSHHCGYWPIAEHNKVTIQREKMPLYHPWFKKSLNIIFKDKRKPFLLLCIILPWMNELLNLKLIIKNQGVRNFTKINHSHFSKVMVTAKNKILKARDMLLMDSTVYQDHSVFAWQLPSIIPTKFVLHCNNCGLHFEEINVFYERWNLDDKLYHIMIS